MRIRVWIEHSAEKQSVAVGKAYPSGMGQALAEIFDPAMHEVSIAWQSQADSGLSQVDLDNTDVLLYWAHCFHDKLPDDIAERIAKRVQDGMGVVFLHSAHWSKPFKKIMGATGSLHWREDNRHERLYNINPSHPIASGVPSSILIPKEEMYGEPFDIGVVEEVVFVGWFPCGEVFRSGFTKHYGKGKVFYFQPGHETYPVYYQEEIRKIICNATHWAGGCEMESNPYLAEKECTHAKPLERSGNRIKIKGIK